jgi:hypothetical protein
MTRARALLCVLALGAAACGGCGYAASDLIRSDIKTVYVQFFDNTTFRRGLEVPLTRAVVDEIKLRTPLLFAPRDEADSILSGELVDVAESTRVRSRTDQVLIRHVTVKVRFRWRDRLTGADIVPEQVVSESVRVAPSVTDTATAEPVDPLVQREASSFDLVFQEAARRLVEKMEKPW